MKDLIRYFKSTFLAEGLLAILRSSLLSGGVVCLLSLSGTWQYFASSLAAHDLRRSAAWSEDLDLAKQPVLVMVDDAGYEKFFDAQSPVSRERVLSLFKTIAEHTPKTSRIVVDIDVSPVTGQELEQTLLDAYLLQEPMRWVLPAVKAGNPDTAQKLKAWRFDLCAKGVGFGLPYVPTEFGYPKITHQFENGLADATLQDKLPCADPEARHVQKALPLQGAAIQSGVILPFNGDLSLLAQMLEATSPSVVVLGGAWGQTDIYGTPFADRFGVQIHAAAIAAGLNNERMAPNVAELLVVWIFISLVSTVLGYLSSRVKTPSHHAISSLPGHSFYEERGKPFLFITLTFLLLMGVSEALAIVHVKTGLWISSSEVGCITLGTMLLTWDWGRTMPEQFHSFRHAWSEVVAKPVARDLDSIAQSLHILRGIKEHWTTSKKKEPMTKVKALKEGLLSVLSLASQTLLPILSLSYALFAPS